MLSNISTCNIGKRKKCEHYVWKGEGKRKYDRQSGGQRGTSTEYLSGLPEACTESAQENAVTCRDQGKWGQLCREGPGGPGEQQNELICTICQMIELITVKPASRDLTTTWEMWANWRQLSRGPKYSSVCIKWCKRKDWKAWKRDGYGCIPEHFQHLNWVTEETVTWGTNNRTNASG